MTTKTPDLSKITLEHGEHETREQGVCAMELVAWLAGKPHTDHPPCASAVIGAFTRGLNDSISDKQRRTRMLMPYIPRIVGTVADDDVEERRSYMALDWIIRVYLPEWMLLVPRLEKHAAALRALPEVVDPTTATQAGELVVVVARDAAAAQAAARAAARAAAGDAWAAARAAAWDAAWDAAWAAARDAWAAARAAAGDAAGEAGAAAWDAARDAAWAKLKPTVEKLQASSLDLLDRMIRLTETSHAQA